MLDNRYCWVMKILYLLVEKFCHLHLYMAITGLSEKDLNYKKDRKKKIRNNLEDVFDGNLYKKNFKGCHFIGTKQEDKSREMHVSLQLNTDGVSIFRSSSYSVWPLYLIINELHPKLRFVLILIAFILK